MKKWSRVLKDLVFVMFLASMTFMATEVKAANVNAGTPEEFVEAYMEAVNNWRDSGTLTTITLTRNIDFVTSGIPITGRTRGSTGYT